MRALWSLGSSLLGAATGQASREYQVGGRHLLEERELSEGGFSFVVQVRDINSGETFALKKILCHDEEALRAAKREVEVLENMPMHKNIVGYFGHAVAPPEGGAAGRLLLLLLELCPGGHLLDLLDAHRGVLPEADLVKAFTDIAEAVFCLHSLSPPVQHRDLKLENVLRGEDGFWKLVDFGSWSSEKTDLSSTPVRQLAVLGEEVGRGTTPMYRPPEMVDVYQRLPIFCAVDLWMLGCILYTLMYNRHPFQEAAALAIRAGQYSLPARSPALAPKLVELLVWLLAQDPRHRPSSRQLVTALWQWHDLEALELPEPVAERKRQLLASAAARAASAPLGAVPAAELAARAHASGRGKSSASRSAAERRAPNSAAAGRRAPTGGAAVARGTPLAAAPAVAPAPTAASAAAAAPPPEVEAWDAFAEEPAGSGGAPAVQEDWVFQGFQSAGPEAAAEAPTVAAAAPSVQPPTHALPAPLGGAAAGSVARASAEAPAEAATESLAAAAGEPPGAGGRGPAQESNAAPAGTTSEREADSVHPT